MGTTTGIPSSNVVTHTTPLAPLPPSTTLKSHRLAQQDADITEAIHSKLLQHIAIIMDGNRRWAKQRHLPVSVGHIEGVKALKRVVRYACRIGLPYMTLYAFSTENWYRDTVEVQLLMKLLETSLQEELAELQSLGVKLQFIGRRDRLPVSLQQVLIRCEEQTQCNTHLTLTVGLDYGSRDELAQACATMLQETQKHPHHAQTLIDALITTPQETLSRYLHTHTLPDPDLMIRPGGETRLSNFLLWQLAYAELHFTSWLWPEMEASHLREACEVFLKKHRRYGR